MKTVKLLTMILLAVNFLTVSLFAKSVSCDDAKDVAVNWIYSTTGEKVSVDDSILDSSGTDKEFHIIRLKPKGWVIVSGDDSVEPVIAYSSKSSLGIVDSLPSGFVAWMDNVDEQIKETKDADTQSDSALEERWSLLAVSPGDFRAEADNDSALKSTAVKEPLLTTQWGQKGFYNDRCPGYSNNEQTLTGSAATAMAQIMHYHKQPSIGTGSHSYTSKTNEFDLSVKFGKTTYKWNDMSNDNIARIIYHAGVAVDMDYGYDASSAYAGKISKALRDYFGYSSSGFEEKSDHNSSSWNNKIKINIDNKLPIVYYNNYGYEEKGNFFAIDGYSIGFDGNKYHINWGRRGVADGWFVLDSTLGESNSGYAQGAVFDISTTGTEALGTLSMPSTLISSTGMEALDVPLSMPSLFTNVTASNGTYSAGVMVSWLGGFNAAFYRVFRNNVDVSGKLPTGSTNFLDTTAKLNSSYSYFVMAYDEQGYRRSDSNTGYRTSTGTPYARSWVFATDGTLTSGVVIKWSHASDTPMYYKIYRDGKYIGLTYNISYKDTKAIPYIFYRYSVQWCSQYICRTIKVDYGWRASGKPAKPIAIKASDGAFSSGVVINSYYVYGASHYKIYRAKSSGGPKAYLDLTYSASYKDKTAWPGYKYYYYVKACKGYECSYYSDHNIGWRNDGIPAKPTTITASDGNWVSNVSIGSYGVSGATHYKIYRATSSGGHESYLGLTYGVGYQDKTATPGKMYYYFVKACNDKGCSKYSDYDTGWRR